MQPLYLVVALDLVVAGLAVLSVIILAKDPSRMRLPPPEGTEQADRVHTLAFTVGNEERHTVVCSFDQVWGWLTVTVDGAMVVKKLVTFTLRLVATFDFPVGHIEVHQVRIEKRRPLLVSFARPQPIRAFVDGVLVAENDGVIR